MGSDSSVEFHDVPRIGTKPTSQLYQGQEQQSSEFAPFFKEYELPILDLGTENYQLAYEPFKGSFSVPIARYMKGSMVEGHSITPLRSLLMDHRKNI